MNAKHVFKQLVLGLCGVATLAFAPVFDAAPALAHGERSQEPFLRMRTVNWYDTEWDYGFAKGLETLIESVGTLRGRDCSVLFPSQGPTIGAAGRQLEEYHRKLKEFHPDYVRGYPVHSLTKRAKPDPILKSTPIPQIVSVTPHLYKFADTLAGKNFAIIISDNGRGLLLDCGLFPEELLAELVGQMRKHLGLKRIDALWINHMHGDHFTLGEALKRDYGAQVWTLDRIADKVENPLRYDYCALITSYNPRYRGLKVDRPLRNGEIVEWEGLKLHFDWMPGQTEFGNCLWLELDGKKIAFTGDNLFGDPSDPSQNGHEAVVARQDYRRRVHLHHDRGTRHAVPRLQLRAIRPGTRDHLPGHVHTDHPTFWSDLFRGEEDVDPRP